MNTQEAIVKSIELLNNFYELTGDLNSEEYIQLLAPLHEALNNLSKKELTSNTNTVII